MTCKLLLGFFLLLTTSLEVCAENPYQRFRSILIDYFGEQGYLPVIVDRGYKIGDVVNNDGVNLYARGERCFPNIKTPTAIEASLPGIVHVEDAGMNFGLMLRRLFDSRIGSDLTRRIEIKFSDVKITSVTLLDLRDAYDRAACPDIAPLIEGTLGPSDKNTPPYFVVSEIVSGKREARLEFATHANLAIKTQELTKEAGSAELAVQAKGDGSISLIGKKTAPIALKPVTVPNVVMIASFQDDFRNWEQGPQQVEWKPVDCPEDQDCWNEFGDFAEQIKATPIELSPEDLDR